LPASTSPQTARTLALCLLGAAVLSALAWMVSAATAAATGPAGTFVSLSPARLMDTRPDGPTIDGVGPKGALGPGDVARLPVRGRGGVPQDGADAVVLNVTAVGATQPSYVTVWPATSPQPLASSLNPLGPEPVANLVTVKLGRDGAVALFNAAGSTHLVVDVSGYYRSGGGFVATEPIRLADTRPSGPTVDGIGPKGALPGGATAAVAVAGRAGVPADATAVVVNLTAVNASAPTFLTVWPTGRDMPLASNLNPSSAAPLANAVTVALGPDGSLSVYNAAGQTDVVVDLAGYFTPASGFRALTPTRLADTRPASCTWGLLRRVDLWGCEPVPADRELRLTVAGVAGMPATGVGAVILNITAVNATGATFVTVWPTAGARPWASSLNPLDGRPVANLVVAKVGLEGSVSIAHAAGSTDLVIDLVGWVPAPPGEVFVAGALAKGQTVDLPGMDAGESVRYELPVLAGEQFSVAASPGAFGGVGLTCDARLAVRRPDGSLSGQARVACDPATPSDRSLDVDVTADVSGTWLVDYRTDVPRRWTTGTLLVSADLDGGLAAMDARTVAPTLAMGQNVTYRFTPRASEPVALRLRPTKGLFPDGCDVAMRLYRPDGTLLATRTAGSADCAGPFGVSGVITLDVAAAEGGTYRLVVDNGGPAARAGMSLELVLPVDLGTVALPVQLSTTVRPAQTVRWTLPVSSGQRLNLAVYAPHVGGCVEVTLRRPDGSVAAERESCASLLGWLTATLRVDVGAAAGTWALTAQNTASSDVALQAALSVDLEAAALPAEGGGVAVPALLPGQAHRVPMWLPAGQTVSVASDFTGACRPVLAVVSPTGSTSGGATGCAVGGQGGPGGLPVQETGTWWFEVRNNAATGASDAGTLWVTPMRDGGRLTVGLPTVVAPLRPGEQVSFEVQIDSLDPHTFNHTYAASALSWFSAREGGLSFGVPYGNMPSAAPGLRHVVLTASTAGAPQATVTVNGSIDAGVLSAGAPGAAPNVPTGRHVMWSFHANAGDVISIPTDHLVDHLQLAEMGYLGPDGTWRRSIHGIFVVPLTGTWRFVDPAIAEPRAAGSYTRVFHLVQTVAYTPTLTIPDLAPGTAIRMRAQLPDSRLRVSGGGDALVSAGGHYLDAEWFGLFEARSPGTYWMPEDVALPAGEWDIYVHNLSSTASAGPVVVQVTPA
jgi:hypothetical protein